MQAHSIKVLLHTILSDNMMEINNNGKIIKVYPSDESELTTGVMTSGKVVLHFRSDQDIKLEQGATIEFLGNTYTLVYPQETKKLWRGYLECIATFYSSAEQLKHKLLKDPSNIARTSFVFAGSPTDFATLVARSMGREWSVGNCVATSYDKTIAFKEESCWAALGRVAEEFHTEWVVEGKTISLRKDERFKEDPLPLSYGKGNGFLSGVSQRGNADNLPISRLYVLGSSRNIDPTKYGASTLHLPKSWSGESMRTDEAGNYIELLEGNGAEGAMELSDLYPHRVGVVSSVVVVNEAKHFYDIIDTSIPEKLNYNDYRIRGEKAILKFETGALAGRQFEIRQSETALSGYHHQERRFELIPSEQDGFIMPSKEWAPKAGDRYAIFGIALPQEYVTRAENELLKEAIRTLSERSLPQFTFEGEVDGIWAKRKWLEIGGKLVPGGHVLFSDPEFHPEGTVIRITSMAQKVNNPTAPSITLSTALVGGSLWNVLNRAEAQEVLSQKRDRELQRSQRQSYEQALEHIGMVERAVEGVEGFSKRIKPSVIETMGLLVGSQATQLDFVERYGSLKSVPMAINYNPSDKRVTISNAFIRHQTIGITSITNARKPTDYRYWSVARYTSPALTELEQSYYIYAKVEREGKGGNYLLSPDPLPFETTTHYHLLIGTLSSLIDGDRAYNRLYGFSMVTPGQILTDTISSANGNMTIDLQNGSIISDQIEFRRPDGSTKSVEEVITDTVQVGGRNLALRTQQPRRLSAGYAYYELSEYLIKDTDYTIQFDVEVLTPPEDNRFMVYFAYSTHLFTRVYIPYESGKTHYSATIKTPNKDGAIVDNLKSVYIYPHGWGNGGDTVSDIAFSNVKLERGTVATDWSPAPEDVQASIENEAKAREAGDKAIADTTQTLEQALDALRESGANDNATLTDLINKANQRLDNLQEQADGEVSNWFYPGEPAPDRAPENEWTTNGLKARHIGDTYTSTDESGEYMGKSWRYTTEFKWQEIHDTLVSQALAQASKAQTTADGKSTTFLVRPTKYEEGDTWVLESSQVLNGVSYEVGTMLFAKQGSGAFVESHWVDKVRYIGATQLKESEEASKRAWEAYANAQAEAERVKAEAHADGIVTAEEQARIQATNKALETAKAYAEAQDKLLDERQKAYADGVLTEAERRAVDVAEKKAKLAETNAKAYSDGVLTEAERKAIAEAKKAYDDAVKRAEELDGQIQVGGRNLLLKSNEGISNSDYSVGRYYIADPSMMVAGESYTIQIWGEAEGVDFSEALWVYNSGGNTEVSNIQKRVNGVWRQTFKWRDDQGKSNSSLVIFRGANHPNYKKGSKTSITRIKLEKGTIATDWSPAPEDVQAEIDAINANPPRINQTTKNWEVYVPSQGKYVDTGRTSVGDDGKAPKIVDGYWYEWDSSRGQYTNTDIKARGIDGKDAVRVRENLMRYSHVANTWFWYPKVTQGRLSKNVSGGVVALTGGDKCTEDYNAESGRYVFVVIDGSGSKDFTDPEAQFVYSAKIRLRAGEAKLLEFGNTSLEKSFSPSAPIKLVGDPLSVYCVKTKRQQGIAVGLSLYLKTDSIVEIYDIKIERVEEGEDPKPTAYIPHPDDLKGEKGERGERGLQGLQGKDGTNGLPGRDGVDGKTSYTHIAYADTATGGGFSQSPTGKAYIGMYVDFVQADSSDPKKYAWSLIKGADGKNGLNGKDGVPGKPGVDGRTPYLHIAYANSQDGKQGFSVSVSEGKSYIGTYTDYTQADSTDPTKYSWSKIKGEDAVVSKVVTIDASGLDENMYYPIAITDTPTSVQNRYRVYTKLFYSSNPSWATYSRGFQCELIWKCFNSSWGGFDVNMQVEVASYKFVNNVPPISQPSQMVEYSVNYTYVRGGGKYYVELQAREQATLDDIKVELVTAKKSYGSDPYIRYLEPQTSITAPITELDKEAKAREKAVQEINAGLSNANTLISTLEKTAKELKEGKLDTKDLPDLQYLLNALQKGDTKIAGGLVLSKIIALSNQVDRITAYLSGYDGTSGDGKILRAGIQYTKTKETVWPIGRFLADYCGYKNLETVPHVNNVITKEALFTWLRQQKEPFEKFNKALSGGTVSFNPSINSSSINLLRINAIIYSHSDSNSEAVAIRHDGTGHFGDIHLNGDRIDYQKTQDANPYLTVGRGTYGTIEEVIRKNDYRAYNPSNITNKSFDYNPDWNTSDEQVSTVEIEVANDNTKVTITVELMQVDTRTYAKNPDKPGWVHTELQAKLNGHHIKGVMEMYNYGYTKEMPADPEYSSEHWDYNREPGRPTDETGRREWRLVKGNKSSRSVEHSVILPKGTHQLEFVFTQVSSSDKHSLPATARVEGIKVLQEFKTDFKQALISPTGARFYGGRDRYFDINYNAYSNAPTAQLTGGLKVDYIDMPGVPLCGAMVTKSGSIVKSFGRYKNKRGEGYPRVSYSYSTRTYTVYHSIPHSNYIPMLTVGNCHYSDQANYRNISAYSFDVNITNYQMAYQQQDFSYICFLSE